MDFQHKHNSFYSVPSDLPVLVLPHVPELLLPLDHFHRLIAALLSSVLLLQAVLLVAVTHLPATQKSFLLSADILLFVLLQLAHPRHIPALSCRSLIRPAMPHCIFSTSSSFYTPLLLFICCHVSFDHGMSCL